MKKLLVSILAIVMTLGMAVTTVNAESSGTTAHSYKAYQVFTGTVKDGKISGVAWADGVNSTALMTAANNEDIFIGDSGDNIFKDATTAAKVAKVLEKLSNSQLSKFAILAGKNVVSGKAVDVTAGTETDLGTAGYYVLVDVTKNVANDSPLLIVTDADGKVTATSKVTAPTLDKTIKSGNAYVKNDLVSKDDVVVFKLEATLPSNYNDFDSYKLVFTDTLPTGLTAGDIVTAKAGTKDLVPANYVYAKDATKNAITITITDLTKLIEKPVEAGTKVVFEYKATVGDLTNIGATGNANSAVLEFSNNPTVEGTGTTVPSVAKVYEIKYTVTKKDQDNVALNGAKFKLYNGTGEGKTLISEIDGASTNIFEWTGLKAGDYTLEESKAPAGYSKMEDLTFTVGTSFGEGGALTVTVSKCSVSGGVSVNSTSQNLETTVIDTDESTLPETGGMGTVLFYALGAMLICGGIAMIMMRKRAK